MIVSPRGAALATRARPVLRAVPRLASALRWSVVTMLVLASSASAQTPPTVRLEQLTSPEVASAVAAGRTTALVPIGGTEQNGPHMALGKHNVRAQALAERIARVLGNALVAPVVAYVPEGSVAQPAAHMRFPGTISVPAETFRSVLESAARSLRLAGFRDIVFLGDHGGYQRDIALVAQRLNREWRGSGAQAHAMETYYRAAEVDFARILAQRGFSTDEIGTHAGLADTSLMLAIDPTLVRPERLASAGDPKQGAGVRGDPRRASAELGQAGVDTIITETVAAIRKATARTVEADQGRPRTAPVTPPARR